ncbi:MAG TPA: hypothetical protein VH372_10875 [Actinospica sp.]|nr:hypothetical protein [Actinospica sp.]
MYDSAKRSLAFTVATGGLLLTGAACTPALAAVVVSHDQVPAQAQDAQSDAGSTSSPADAAFRADAADAAARRVLSGGSFLIPADAFTACGDAAHTGAFAAAGHGAPCAHIAEDSSPTVPGAPAAKSGGASATAMTGHDGGIVTDDPWRTPARRSAAVPAAEKHCGCKPPKTRTAHRHTPAHRHMPAHARPSTPPTQSCGCGTPTTPPTTPWTPPTTPWTPPTAPPTTPWAPPTSPCGCQTPTPPPTSPSTPPTTPATSPTTVHSAPPPPPNTPPGGGLAHTGADIGIALGVSGAALIGGIGLRAAARRREDEGEQ